MTKPRVLFLGPCHKLKPRSTTPYPAFDDTSRSGRFLRQAIGEAEIAARAKIEFGNILPGPSLDAFGKERYPTWQELATQARNHGLWRLRSADVVVALSASVKRALEEAAIARTRANLSAGPRLIALRHPSYMLRRPIEERQLYVRCLRQSVLHALENADSLSLPRTSAERH